MPTYSGKLQDFRFNAHPTLQPRLTFTPSGPGFDSSALRFTRPIEVTPAADGTFTVVLQSSTLITPITWYEITITWLDSAGNFISLDEVPGRLFTGETNGALTDFIDTGGATPGQAWWGLEEPIVHGPYMWWLHSNPDNPDDPAATGDLYEWS